MPMQGDWAAAEACAGGGLGRRPHYGCRWKYEACVGQVGCERGCQPLPALAGVPCRGGACRGGRGQGGPSVTCSAGDSGLRRLPLCPATSPTTAAKSHRLTQAVQHDEGGAVLAPRRHDDEGEPPPPSGRGRRHPCWGRHPCWARQEYVSGGRTRQPGQRRAHGTHDRAVRAGPEQDVRGSGCFDLRGDRCGHLPESSRCFKGLIQLSLEPIRKRLARPGTLPLQRDRFQGVHADLSLTRPADFLLRVLRTLLGLLAVPSVTAPPTRCWPR